MKWLFLLIAIAIPAAAADHNAEIVSAIRKMPKGGTYARYRSDLPADQRFDELYLTVSALGEAIALNGKGGLVVKPKKAAALSFCSSATYLLFVEVVQDVIIPSLGRAVADVGSPTDVIHGKLDGVGIFGHWNADGPGTAVLFERLDLGANFSDYGRAKPGDFMKIFWNENIGKGERGHLVVYLGTSDDGKSVKVWSSNLINSDDSSGYGTMWVEKSRIRRVVFSRLERPENLARWLEFSKAEQTSDYLVRIRKTGSSGEEMRRVVGMED